MPKIAELMKIQARFNYHNLHTNQLATGELYLFFRSEQSAVDFHRALQTIIDNNQPDKTKFVNTYPQQVGPLYYVRLYLGFGQTNRNMTAVSILEFLQTHFELPLQVEIAYPEEVSSLKDNYVMIPMSKSHYISLPLNQFLIEIALEQSQLQSRLGSLIGTTVSIKTLPMQPKGCSLQITCGNEGDAKMLKRKLFNCALELNLESQLHFNPVTGVAGIAHPESFILTTDADLDFGTMLKSLVAISISSARLFPEGHTSMEARAIANPQTM